MKYDMKQQLTHLRRLWPLALVAALLLTGCVKRDLEERGGIQSGPGEGIVDIALHWEQEQHPASARYLFYNEAGELVREESGITERFRGVLPAGKYRLVVHNTDAANVDYRGTERYETAEVFAKENLTWRARAARGSKSSTSFILEPKETYGIGRCREFEVIEVVAGGTHQATVCPVLLTRQVKLMFRIVNPDVTLQSLQGALDGVSPGIFIATGSCNSLFSCATPFVGKAEPGSNDYTAELTVFNLVVEPNDPQITNNVDITLVEQGGTSHDGRFDITEVVDEIVKEHGGEIPVEIPVEVEVEVKIEPLGGLTITVKPWEEGSGEGDFQ